MISSTQNRAANGALVRDMNQVKLYMHFTRRPPKATDLTAPGPHLNLSGGHEYGALLFLLRAGRESFSLANAGGCSVRVLPADLVGVPHFNHTELHVPCGEFI